MTTSIKTHLLNTLYILIGLTLLAMLVPANTYRWDLTENNAYELSEFSQHIATSIDDMVQIHLYFSSRFPSHLHLVKDHVLSVLDTYRQLNPNYIQIKELDPDENPALAHTAATMGLPKFQVKVNTPDRSTMMSGMAGIIIYYQDQQHIIPMILHSDNLEFKLSIGIHQLIQKTPTKIGLISPSISQTKQHYQVFLKQLQERYDVQSSLADTPIDPSLKSLLILHPKQLSENQLNNIDQYLHNGGQVVLLNDSIEIHGNHATPIKSGLEPLLKNIGIQIQPELIIGDLAGLAPFYNQVEQLNTPSPLWPVIKRGFMRTDHPITNEIPQLTLPYVSPYQYTPRYPLRHTILVNSSPQSALLSAPYNLDPQHTHLITSPQQYPLIGLWTGRFPSLFNPEQLATKKGTLSVIGTSLVAQDISIKFHPNNLSFMLNLMDYLNLGSQDILPKAVTQHRPLPPLSPQTKRQLQWGITFLSPGLILIIGLLIYIKRKNQI